MRGIVKERELVLENITPVEKLTFKKLTYFVIKRIVDFLGGLCGVILLIPITLVVILFRIKNKEEGPIFYTQDRIGKNGKVFKLYKFRTMVVGADNMLKEYLDSHPEENLEYKKFKKLKNDPRVTKTGDFLRRTSLDEWPQFINILIGNMSLVGPRPYLLREKEDMA